LKPFSIVIQCASIKADVAVEREKLNAILEMACAAPSAGDLQSYKSF